MKTISCLVLKDILLYFGQEPCTLREEKNLDDNITQAVFLSTLCSFVIISLICAHGN